MPEFHAEPFLHLAGLTHKSVLIAWGAFYFKVKGSEGKFKLVDDGDLDHIHPPRHQTMGASSEPYGDARVEVLNGNGGVIASASAHTTNYCWVSRLEPDTEYSYRVIVNGEEWAAGERRDWAEEGGDMGLKQTDNTYDNRFRTHPDPTRPAPEPLTFAVFGDYGTGIKKANRPQGKVAAALKEAVDKNNVRLILTTGDNIYAGKKFLGLPVGDEGDEDDDWYFTYYQPYRYIINRVPVYPCIGNHDAGETESKDDRAQLVDNLYIDQRIAGEEAAGRASIEPGLFYRFRFGSDIEFICIDTSMEPAAFSGGRLFQHPKHMEFLKAALPDQGGVPTSPTWRIPFSHHPPFSAGPKHGNTKEMAEAGLVDMFQRAGVRMVFNGHEHNCQHSSFNRVNYFVTGAGGQINTKTPKDFQKAHTVSWCAKNHFLLVTIDEQEATVTPVGVSEEGVFTRNTPGNEKVTDPIVVTLG